MTVPLESLKPFLRTEDGAAAFPIGATVGEVMPATMAAAVSLKVGDVIRGNHKDWGVWYPAKVVAVEAEGRIFVRYDEDGVEERLSAGSYRRLFTLLPPKYRCFNTMGWKVVAHKSDGGLNGHPVFRRPAPPVSHRGSASTSRIVQFIWRTHPEIRDW